MKFVSTRGKGDTVTAAQAIIQGLAPDGGLFVPEGFPVIKDISALCGMSYPERAAHIMGLFFNEWAAEELLDICEKAYADFEDGDPAPLVKLDEDLYILELWHGPTQAFKDMALAVLPRLLVSAKQKTGDNSKTLILTATSGDTGKAALEGFKDVEGMRIVVLYPTDGVSAMQKLQMATQEGNNVEVIAIRGNFDDAQTAVKSVFEDAGIAAELAKRGEKLSSANSINIGRLIPQIAYYFSAYADLLSGRQIKAGDKVNFVVPSGNFGNILAGYYAYRMGLPVGKLICASNKNNVLTDFFANGEYNIKDREFFKTTSPSMDILVSSNLERLIYEMSGPTADKMAQLKKDKSYKVTQIDKIFMAEWANEDEVAETVEDYFEEYGYVADPHTGVALTVYDCDGPTVVVSTASPYKFAADTLRALGEEVTGNDRKDCAKLEDLTAMPVPKQLKELFGKKVRFDKIIEIGDIKSICQ